MTSFMQDLRYGLQVLVKNPGFAAIAVLTIRSSRLPQDLTVVALVAC